MKKTTTYCDICGNEINQTGKGISLYRTAFGKTDRVKINIFIDPWIDDKQADLCVLCKLYALEEAHSELVGK